MNHKSKNRMEDTASPQKLTIILFALLLTIFPVRLIGQDEEEEVFELSPFTVDASEDEGYRATSTLAGSRLRTDFKHVASQVSVFTKELMDDLGVENAEEAFLYSLNVENDTEFFATDQPSRSSTPATRMRGLGAATRSRNFFETRIKTDSYNTDRLTIASGPNSILFGLGNPSGIVDVTLKNAIFSDRTEVGMRFDSNNSMRFMIDANRVLSEDKLAIRIASLYDENKGHLAPNGNLQKRIYGALTYKPSDRLTFRIHYENQDRSVYRMQTVLPGDDVTAFFHPQLGNGQLWDNKSAWENGTPRPVWLTGGSNRVVITHGATEGPPPEIQVFQANQVRVRNMNDIVRAVSNNGAQPDHPLFQPNWVDTLDNFAWRGYNLSNDDLYPIFDKNMYGSKLLNDIDGKTFNAFIEFNPIENLYFELAYNSERYREAHGGLFRMIDYQINIDPNMYLPNPDPANQPWELNPNAGKFYIGGESWGWIKEDSEEEFRATVSYEFDFSEENSWFGRHRVSGLYSDRDTTRIEQNFFRYVRNADDGTDLTFLTDSRTMGGANANLVRGNQRRVEIRQYIDFSTGDIVGRPITEIAGADVGVHGTWVLTDPGNGKTFRTPLFGDDGRRAAFANRANIKSTSLAYQGFFWEDRIVLTYGRREDASDKATLNIGGALPNGLQPTYVGKAWNPFEPEVDVTNTLKGIVFRPPLFPSDSGIDIGFFYNESTNNSRGSSQRNLDGRPNPPVSGDGKDYGVMLDLFNGKLNLRYNEYETSQVGAQVSNDFNGLRDAWANVEERYGEILQGDGQAYSIVEGFDPLVLGRSIYRLISDTTAEGKEVEMTYRPADGWNFRLTYADSEAVFSNISPHWRAAALGRESDYAALRTAELDANGDPTGRTVGWDEIPLNEQNWGDPTAETMQENYANVVSQATFLTFSEGRSNPLVRSERINLTGSYQFQEGKMKPFKVGGTLRRRGDAVIGFAPITVDIEGGDPLTIADVNKPFFSPGETFADLFVAYRGKMKDGKIEYRIQLNAVNAFNNDGPYPSRSTSDGTPRHWAQWAPRKWVLTTNFTF